ncbi:hypothetical protein HYFRA_00002238 [Hymenoscyphus fraxineus]|uniref:Heterokaryon incompatibility domain-containing protein n=1 Tax=Hymenoscyphus fraxineus TaxID=746836 RepID=A0A9N9KK33_9HELO|nr:hypothetical protein HYFRA_00002238 [Hymenoscyphus fraxineus]
MSLCELCKAIPIADLPSLPPLVWNQRSESRFHRFLSPPEADFQESHGWPYHKSLKDLQASAEMCDLCKLILVQAEQFIAGLEELDESDFIRQTSSSFDLWLTKRRHGGDGFWVFTSGTPRLIKRHVTFFLVAAVGICVAEDSPMAKLLPGRPVDEHTHLEVILNRISAWVNTCDAQHPICQTEIMPMPELILDVTTGKNVLGNDFIRLCESKNISPERYIALSHCWGDPSCAPINTTKSTLEERKRGISFDELPVSFKDAVVVTRSLGIRYLWIDSLCIIQDDAKDWERQSGRMAAIYSYSYLVLAATRAQNSRVGFLNPRTSRAHITLNHKQEGVEEKVLAFVLPLRKEAFEEEYVDMTNEPLSDRAWCFQERVLSHRTLHFSSDQMYFECIDGFRSEDGLYLIGRFDSIHKDAILFRYRIYKQSKPKQVRPFVQWLSLLQGYGPRALTKASDKLPALSGIAKIFGERMNDEYIAGIWKGAFLESLLWLGVNINEVADPQAPSWSWAHYKGICTDIIRGDEAWDPIGAITSYHNELESQENPYGRVKEGSWIEIHAPLVPLPILQCSYDNIYFRTANGDATGIPGTFDLISRRYSQSVDLVRRMEIFALVLIGGLVDADRQHRYRCLLVTPTNGGADNFRRIGYTSGTEKSLGIKVTDFVSQRVVLF